MAEKYNPFPEISGPDAEVVFHNSGISYSRVGYADEEVARRVAAHVRELGSTANGGFMHGSPLGTVDHVATEPERPYTDIYPERFLSEEDKRKVVPAHPEYWEVTY